jgi:hypothetical protein
VRAPYPDHTSSQTTIALGLYEKYKYLVLFCQIGKITNRNNHRFLLENVNHNYNQSFPRIMQLWLYSAKLCQELTFAAIRI